ncbi:BRISC complex subunit Abraxas 2-like [Diadema antillarum]|uniref:BRISC complex subunit Abraxas 2-like n=1 Tax=Diadema antillarum TaxID=105358 RepID=UPI003A884472
MAVVNISGSVWSSLHYDNSCCDGDQEGFLIGEVIYRETTNISDSQITRKTEEVDINVTSHCPCRGPFSFYDGKGYIDQGKVMALLKSNFKNVVGFYRFRRNTLLQPSLREMVLYKRLLARLRDGVQPETFLLGIFSCSSSWNLATHTYPYQFFTYGFTGFQARKVCIVNLGDTAESEYKLATVQSAISSGSTCFQQILHSYGSKLGGQDATLSGVQAIKSLSTDIHNKLQEVKQKVCDTEGRLRDVSQEVFELRRRAQRQRHERMARQKMAGQVLNTNNNAGLRNMQPPTSSGSITSLESAMETHSAICSNAPLREAGTASPQPVTHTQHQQPSAAPQTSQHHNAAAPSSLKQDLVEQAAKKAAEAKPTDPFAGLLMDMKQSITKSRSSSLNSQQAESASQQGSVNGAERRTVDSQGAGPSPSSQDGSQGHSKAGSGSGIDDDETQIDGDAMSYTATLSPTF